MPGLDGIFQQLPSPPRGDALPERSGRTLAVTDSSSPQAGTSGQRRQHRCHLGQGTVCPSEPTWDGRVDGWLPSRDEEVVKSCGNNRVNNHLQREHGELGTRSHKPPKPSISRSCRWEGQPRPRDASSRPVPMPSCAGSASTRALREGEPGGSCTGKPESSTSHRRDAALKRLLETKWWHQHHGWDTCWEHPWAAKGLPGTPSRLKPARTARSWLRSATGRAKPAQAAEEKTSSSGRTTTSYQHLRTSQGRCF